MIKKKKSLGKCSVCHVYFVTERCLDYPRPCGVQLNRQISQQMVDCYLAATLKTRKKKNCRRGTNEVCKVKVPLSFAFTIQHDGQFFPLAPPPSFLRRPIGRRRFRPRWGPSVASFKANCPPTAEKGKRGWDTRGVDSLGWDKYNNIEAPFFFWHLCVCARARPGLEGKKMLF